jgi:oligoendopeptidase F
MTAPNISAPAVKTRTYLPPDFRIENWEQLEPHYKELYERPVNSAAELQKWLRDRSELESVVSENLAWRYIRMTCDTTDKKSEEAYLYFVSEIEPHISPFTNKLNIKLAESPYLQNLKGEGYRIYIRGVRKEIEIFREENISLFVEIQQEQQKYASISGAMTVTLDGQELTLQQAARYLKDTDRKKREEAFGAITARRLKDKEELDKLFSRLIKLRNKVALNAGFGNFRDYMFAALGRFDYTAEDCFKFHEAISTEVVPLVKMLNEERAKKLNVGKLRPWDMEVDTSGKSALTPFSDGADLLEKSIACFQKLDPYFSQCLTTMKDLRHLDLESRIGKAPGGYNYPLAETGIPFIFMNAASTLRDVETMVHEGGHAIHSFLTRDLELHAFKNCPSEVAELASMSMELISMDAWDVYMKDPGDLKRARMEQLEGVIKVLPWIATVDKFQHWIYTNPENSPEERKKAWLEISDEFSTHTVDYSGWEDSLAYSWQKQLHIYEVPFYYIEYGFAQLGAIAVWKNYIENPQKALKQYQEALSLGYTRTIGDIYETAGVRFDFTRGYVKELAHFVKGELQKVI